MQTQSSFRATSLSLRMVSVVGILVAAMAPDALAGPADEAKQIASLAGFHGGLAIHVACGDGQLTAALRLADNCVVQGLETDAKRVETARAAIRAMGLYGPVSVMHWSGKKLPYVDNLATLVVCEDAGAVPAGELLRVLRPNGAAAVKRNGQWTVTVKPQLEGADEWQQHYHGADNNAVAQDVVVGPPRRYQWLGEPEWQRAHFTLPSITSMVSAKGRLFTVEDLGSAEHPALPGKHALVARDAYNGIVLWRVMFPDWLPIYIGVKSMPVQFQRRLAAVGDAVYCTAGYSAPITAFDAATGRVMREYERTAGTVEFVHDRGVLYVVAGDPYDVSRLLRNSMSRNPKLDDFWFKPGAYGPTARKSDDTKNEILAVDAASGQELWRISGSDTKDYEGATLGVIGDRVVYATTKELVCLDRATGKSLWRVGPIDLKASSGVTVSLVLSDRAAYVADVVQLRAFRLTDGQALWARPVRTNHTKPPDVFLANGLVWTGAYVVDGPAAPSAKQWSGANGFDPETGKLVKQLDQKMSGPMGHDRCYRNRITTQYYINTATGGSDFLGLSSASEFPNPWIRSTCGIGPLPCNGLYYVGPIACGCCNHVMLNGMNAMAAEPGLAKSDQPIRVAAEAALEKGPAFDFASSAKGDAAIDDWPTYRHDNARTGTTKNKTPAALAKRWEAKIGARASAPVIAAGMVFVADMDGHAVCALSAADGKSVWRFSAEGRVDSPPTYYRGLLLFGSRDGSVYCLRASDGALAWRFLPLERRLICAYGQPESAWPICGSVLVRDGLVYFAAGRNSFTDGGIFLYALDPRSGNVVHQKRMYGPFGAGGFQIANSGDALGTGIEGFKGDVFVADDQLLYLRHQAFNADLSPVRPQDVKQPHLIPSHGFLTAIPNHRSFWTIDVMLRYDLTTGEKGGVRGDILVIDGERFYEVRGYIPGRHSLFDPRSGRTVTVGGSSGREPDPRPGYTLYAGKYRIPATDSADADTTAAKAKGIAVLGIVTSEKLWSSSIPLTGKAIALANDVLFVAGTPVVFPENDLGKAYEGRMGGILWAASASTGEKLAQYALDAPPAWDGLAAANGMLFLSLADGRVLCMGP